MLTSNPEKMHLNTTHIDDARVVETLQTPLQRTHLVDLALYAANKEAIAVEQVHQKCAKSIRVIGVADIKPLILLTVWKTEPKYPAGLYLYEYSPYINCPSHLWFRYSSQGAVIHYGTAPSGYMHLLQVMGSIELQKKESN